VSDRPREGVVKEFFNGLQIETIRLRESRLLISSLSIMPLKPEITGK